MEEAHVEVAPAVAPPEPIAPPVVSEAAVAVEAATDAESTAEPVAPADRADPPEFADPMEPEAAREAIDVAAVSARPEVFHPAAVTSDASPATTQVKPRVLGIDPAVEARRVRALAHWEHVASANQTLETFAATITSLTNAGLLVEIGGVRGFLPASQVRLEPGATLESLVKSSLQVTIVDVDQKRHRVVVSNRKAVDGARRNKRAELLRSLELGQVHEATVVRLVPFGAFVDIGGVEGLVPMSELAFERIEKVEDLLKVGDTFPASVLRIDEGGRKIALSRKNALPDPWRDHADVVRPGAVVEGTVVSKEIGKDAGLRVEIAPGIIGAIRDSDANPDEYAIGEKVEVTVRFADRRTRKIRLGTTYAAPQIAATSSGFAPLGAELRR
jgi:small subunit ribosomal protein S1